jgi:hypothetical protein
MEWKSLNKLYTAVQEIPCSNSERFTATVFGHLISGNSRKIKKKTYPPVIKHGNGKSPIHRCFSKKIKHNLMV